MKASQHKILLIVEDEAAQLKMLTEEFEDEGFTVLEARNGKEGLAIALREHPDLILLDIVMPIMDGLTMMQKLREENVWGKKVPIILLTNLSSDDEKRMKAVIRDEPAYYLVKSDHPLTDVVQKVKERLANP